MDPQLWTDVDGYLVSLLVPPESSLEKTLADSTAAGLPEINVGERLFQ